MYTLLIFSACSTQRNFPTPTPHCSHSGPRRATSLSSGTGLASRPPCPWQPWPSWVRSCRILAINQQLLFPLKQNHLAIHPAHDSSDHRESDHVGPNKCQYSLIRHHPHYQQHFPLVQVQEQDPLQWHDNAVPEGRDHRRCSDLVCQRYLPANR